MKKLLTLALAVAFLLVTPMTAEAATKEGWNQDANGWWYGYKTETGVDYYKDEVVEIEGKTYYFDETGYMEDGWFTIGDYTWYYAENGAMATGWKYIDGEWYYFDKENFWMYSGWGYTEEIDGKEYMFAPSGEMISGWYNMAGSNSVYGSWYYCNADGTVYDGWLLDGGKWYYIDNGSAYQDGYAMIDDVRYWFDQTGAMVTGWYKDSYESANYSQSRWVYANADGSVEEQWVASGSDWYYVNEYGYMRTGLLFEDGYYDVAEPEWKEGMTDAEWEAAWDKYEAARNKFVWVLGEDGKLAKGWTSFTTNYGTTWYYADANGNAYTGWVADGANWYYVSEGEMCRNTTVDGCYLNADGVWVR